VDYKTGEKSFKLPDILFGLNLQMLLYLYCIIRGQDLSDDMAAGILYKPAKRDINDKGLAMKGLLSADESLLRAMEKDLSGEYIPKLTFTKSGAPSKSESFIENGCFSEIFDYIEKIMKKTGNSIISGDISVCPINGRESDACKYCDYGFICGIEDEQIPKVEKLGNSKVMEIIRGGENVGD